MVAVISCEAAAGASDAVSFSLLGSLPSEAANAVVEAGGRVNAKINLQDSRGVTLLMGAAGNGCERLVEVR